MLIGGGWKQATATGSPASALTRLRRKPLLDLSAVDCPGLRDRAARRLFAASDGLALLGALFTAMLLAGQRADEFAVLGLLLLTLPAWMLVFKAYGLYDRPLKRITHSALDDIPRLGHALLVGGLLFWGLCRALPVDQLTLLEAALFGMIALVAVVAMRRVAVVVLGRWRGHERVLIIGGGPLVERLARILSGDSGFGIEVVGVLDGDARAGAEASGAGADQDAWTTKFERAIAARKPDRIIISHSDFETGGAFDAISYCRRYSIKVSVLPDALEVFGPSTEVDEVHGIAVLAVANPALGRTSLLVKRCFDLLVASIALLFAAPLMAAAALAIRLDSRGPVFFSQSRVGRNGTSFQLHKFRSMLDDAERFREDLMAESVETRWLDLQRDPRVTRVGRILRRTSLDELPQLFNVLRGEMSIVGPRPLPENEDCHVTGWGRGRLDLTPGITGLWQVLGRTQIPFDEMVKLDYLYVSNWSLWLDISLLLRTFPAVFSGRGAN